MRTKNRYFTLSLLGTALFATVCSAGAILGVAAEEVAGGDTTGTDVQTENFVTSQEGWDALPAGWAFGDGVITSTSNAFLGGGIMRDYYADTPSDYTVSATLHNTATDNGAEIGLGIIPWAQDTSNYVIVSVKWNANRSPCSRNALSTACNTVRRAAPLVHGTKMSLRVRLLQHLIVMNP